MQACHGHPLLLEVSEREEGVMAVHLLIGHLKTRSGLDWIRYRDANPVPTSSLADDTATAPSGPVIGRLIHAADIRLGHVIVIPEFVPWKDELKHCCILAR